MGRMKKRRKTKVERTTRKRNKKTMIVMKKVARVHGLP